MQMPSRQDLLHTLTGAIEIFGVGMRFQLFCVAIWLFASCSLVVAQTPEKNWRLERKALERLYADDLQELANELRSNGDGEAARATLDLFQVRDPQRQYIFLPSEDTQVEPKDETETRIRELNARHAERIFELAKQSAASGSGASAFQFLHEVLYFNPEHKAVREMLGHRKTDDGWRVAPERVKVKKATRANKDLGWEKGTYLQVTTPHFEINSLANEEDTLALAKKLERWHGVWRQVFFEFWSSSKQVDGWIRGKGKLRNTTRKHQVTFFPDKATYAEQLEPRIKGIGESSGYYSDQWRNSFFYAGEETTWRHELTHQLFQETRKANVGAFNDGYLWLGEGIAMYLESLVDFEDYITLGGFDAQRLQYSRMRLFRNRFFVEPSVLSGMTLSEFQSSPERGKFYSQSAGMCHYLMNGEDGVHQAKLIEFLKLIYTGKLREGSFEKIMELNDEKFQNGYFDFLRTRNETIERYLFAPLTRLEFSLANGSISLDAMEQIGKCHNLELLDLSENQLEPEELKQLVDCDKLDSLYLSNCKIQRGSLRVLKELAGLREIDLTASDCTDEEFADLAECSKLAIVSIKATPISAEAISNLKAKLPNLEVRQ